jgi:hypothetical protein
VYCLLEQEKSVGAFAVAVEYLLALLDRASVAVDENKVRAVLHGGMVVPLEVFVFTVDVFLVTELLLLFFFFSIRKILLNLLFYCLRIVHLINFRCKSLLPECIVNHYWLLSRYVLEITVARIDKVSAIQLHFSICFVDMTEYVNLRFNPVYCYQEFLASTFFTLRILVQDSIWRSVCDKYIRVIWNKIPLLFNFFSSLFIESPVVIFRLPW